MKTIERQIWLILIFAALALLFGCASPQYSPVPPASTNDDSKLRLILEHMNEPDPPKTSKVELPPEPEVMPVQGNATPAVAMSKNYWLAWDYGDTSNIRFELWKSDKPQGPFGYWTNVAEKSAAMPIDRLQQFFILRASNTVTRLVSDWSHH